MKKLLAILFLIAITATVFGQGRTNTQLSIPNGYTYLSYTGKTADTLTAALDSIMIPVFVNSQQLYKPTIGVELLKGGSATDTICKVSIWGKNFENESYTYLGTVSSAAVSSATVVTQKTYAYNTAVQYRFLRIHLMRPTPVTGAGTKIKINKLELSIWRQ